MTSKGWWASIRGAKEHINQHLFDSVFIVLYLDEGKMRLVNHFTFKFMCVEINSIHLFLNYFLKPLTFYFARTGFQGVLWYPQPPAKPAQKLWNIVIVLNLLKYIVILKIKIIKKIIKRISDLSTTMPSVLKLSIKHKKGERSTQYLFLLCINAQIWCNTNNLTR